MLFLVVAGLNLFAALALGVQVLASRHLLAAVLHTQSRHAVSAALPSLLLFAGITTLSLLATQVGGQLQRLQADAAVRSIWLRVMAITTSVDLITFDDPAFHDQLQRIELNALSRPLTVVQGLVGLLGGVTGIAGLAAVLGSIQPYLIPLLLVGAVPLFLVNRRNSATEFSFSMRAIGLLRRREYVRELLTERETAKEIRAYGLSGTLLPRYESMYEEYLGWLRAHVYHRSWLIALGQGLLGLVTAGTLVVLLIGVQHGLGLAGAGAAALAIPLLATRLGTLATGIGQLFESGLFLADVTEFVSRWPTGSKAAESPAAESPAGETLQAFETLEVDRVSFTYPGARSPALRKVSLTVNAGEVVALVGENGSGKTTLAKLLADLYQPASGRILWDGRDMAELDQRAVRDQIAVVFQDFEHYATSAYDNVAFGRASRYDDSTRVRRAARVAGIDSHLAKLADGYETPLSTTFGGTDLSGGQWQRIALARAFFRDAAFVVLDEPTAALDARAEHELFSRVRTLLAGRTVLLVTHRFATVREADRIVVLRTGRVVETGTHTELLATGGLYSELFRMQSAAFVDGD